MSNTQIKIKGKLPTFNELQKELPLSETAKNQILLARDTVENILTGKDGRILLIVGPCSIHNVDEAYQYAKLLKTWAEKHPQAFVMMRVCCDKPRTKKDWRGIFNDPNLDGSHDLAKGFRISRKLMVDICELGLPIACEALSPANFHVVSDIVSYAWVGARTGSSPDVREMTSGLSMPVGVKNSNESDSLDSALHAIDFARHSSTFAGPDNDGVMSIIETTGNTCPHLILRGGKSGPNYGKDKQIEAVEALTKSHLIYRFVVDISHGNCNKDYLKQIQVLQELVKCRTPQMVGVMVESYLNSGKQNGCLLGTPEGPFGLKPGLSVTDACLGWDETAMALSAFLNNFKK
jgi:3-deoxy-7-phosphoheptulonate synthase